MKLLAYFLTCLIILINTTDSEAAQPAEIYSNVENEISNYYLAGGFWKLQKIDNAEIVHYKSSEYILANATAHIKNVNTGEKAQETCLLSFIYEDNSFHSINCF